MCLPGATPLRGAPYRPRPHGAVTWKINAQTDSSTARPVASSTIAAVHPVAALPMRDGALDPDRMDRALRQ